MPTAGVKNKAAKGSSAGKAKGKAKSKGKTLQQQAAGRDAVYAEPLFKLHVGENALHAEMARELLGWEYEDKEGQFGDEYLAEDIDGKKVRCTNNVNNRPFYTGVAAKLRQEILNRRWRFNGEPIIIGQTGLTLDGQHTLFALATAAQEWRKNPDQYPQWEDEPTIDKLVVYGVEETDEVVNTINTGKPRSLTDVIYRSEYFAALKSKDRKACARLTDNAVKLLWDRTGAKADAFSPIKTHSESLDFITRHSQLLKAVKYIYEENEKGAVEKYVTPGYASALLYLMGTSATDSSMYLNARSEEVVNFDLWEKAEEFWTLVASGGADVLPLKKALGKLLEDGAAGHKTRIALLCKAWECFVEGKKMTEARLELLFHVGDDDGVRTLASIPYLGGLDVGPQADEVVIEGDEVEQEEAEAEEAEVEQRKAEEKKNSLRRKAEENREAKAEKPVKEGDTVYVVDPKNPEGTYKATVHEIPVRKGPKGHVAMVKVANGFARAGTIYEVPLAHCQHRLPV